MNKDDAEKKIRKLAAEGKVEFSPQDSIEAFDQGFVDEFLSAICDVSGAWISDLSTLSDFPPEMEEMYSRIEKKYGVDVRGKNLLVDVFRIIHATNRTVQ